jgi:hypothetical protein
MNETPVTDNRDISRDDGDSGTSHDPSKASGAYRIRILPAGRNDKVVEVSDPEGNVLKYIHSRYHLGNSEERREVDQVRLDYETLGAGEFAGKYGLAEAGER